MSVLARLIVRLFWESEANLPGRLVKWAMLRAGVDFVRGLRVPFANAIADGMLNWPERRYTSRRDTK